MELFEHYIKTDCITFKHARGKSIESGKEFHTYHEIILFLDGNAELITEELHIDLSPNSLIIIPKESYHQIIFHGKQENYYRCVINFTASADMISLTKESMNKISVIEADIYIEYLFKKLTENIYRNNAKKLLNAVLILLLNDIENKSSISVTERSQNVLICNAIRFINSNLHRKLTIDEIAKNCNISSSSLSHLFKKEMNIPLHKFIIKKRLINAYHKISLGESASSAAIECGFSDYSGFYKQYKKMFGFCPSQNNQKEKI